jgi:hypothetical protein
LFFFSSILRDTHGDSSTLNLGLVTAELTAFWIDSFPRKEIELPQVGWTGEYVAVELPIGKVSLLVGTIPLIRANAPSGQVDKEDEFITYLEISNVTFPEVVEGSYREPTPA